MTAAKVMDIISRLPGCSGQAADAVSAYTLVKMEDLHKLLKIPKSECPDIWIRLHRHKWPKSWSGMEDPVVPLERNLYGLLWQDCYGKGNLRKSYWNSVGRRFPTGNAYLYTVNKGCSYLCVWLTSNWPDRNKTLIRSGKYLCKTKIWENRHHSLTMFILGVPKQARILWTIIEICLNPKSLQVLKKSYSIQRNLAQTFRHGLMMWKVMQRNVWSDISNRRTEQLNSETKSQLHALMTLNLEKKKMGSVGELSKVCSRFF